MLNKPDFTRFFFAIDLSSLVKNQIDAFMQRVLKSKFSLYPIEWIKKEKLHITLQFLKQINSQDIPKMIVNVKNELKSTKSFCLEFSQVEFFPSHKQQRILSLHIEPKEILLDLSINIGLGVKATGYALEPRPFKEHLTLGRIRQPQKQKLSLNSLVMPRFGKMQVEDIVLFRSQPSTSGSIYIPISRIHLA